MRFYRKYLPKISSPKDREIVFANFISLTTLQGLSFILPLLLIPYLIRIIGASNFGLIAFAGALVQYFLILTDYGFSLSATQNIALNEGQHKRVCEIFSSVITIKILLSALSFVILLAIINFVPKFKQDWLVYLVSFGAVIGSTLFPLWFFQGKEKMIHITAINSLGGIANVICVFFYVRGPADFLLVPFFNSLFSIVSGIWGLSVAFKEFDIRFTLQSYRNIRQELKAGWSVFISGVAINAYTTTRIFAVGLLTNNLITGYYSIAERIANFIQVFPLMSFSQAVFPRLNRVYLKNKNKALSIMHKVQRISTSGFWICLPVLFIFSPAIVLAVCGEYNNEVIVALRLLLVSIIFIGSNAFRVQFLLIARRADLYSKLHIAAALIGSPLIFLLTYFFSYRGAAVSTIIMEAGVFIVTIRLLKMATKK